MSSVIFSQHQKSRTFNGCNCVSPLSLAGYRLRLLRHCLSQRDQTRVVYCSSAESATTVAVTPPSTDDVAELLDFLQQDAAPYEVKVPPYLQVPGDPRRGQAQRRRAGDIGRAPKPSTAVASKNIQEGKLKVEQYRRVSSSVTAAVQARSSSVPPGKGTAAAAAAARTRSQDRTKSRRQSETIKMPSTGADNALTMGLGLQEPSTSAAVPLPPPQAAVPADERSMIPFSQLGGPLLSAAPVSSTQTGSQGPSHLLPSQAAASTPDAARGVTLGVASGPRAVPQRPRRSFPNDAGKDPAAEAASSHAAGRVVTHGSSRTVLSNADERADRGGHGRAVPSGAGTGGDAAEGGGGSSSARAGGDAAEGSVAAARTVGTGGVQIGDSSPFRGGGGSSNTQSEHTPDADRSLAVRRAAVMWQWNQLLGLRSGGRSETKRTPHQAEAAPARSIDGPPARASSAAAAPAGPHPAAAPSLAAIIPAAATVTPPSSSGAVNLREALTNRHAPPTAAGGHGQRSPPLPPPSRPVPNAALGFVDAALAATEAAVAPPSTPTRRVPAALLPLTLQGRISLMEAAMAAAAAGAAAEEARQPGKAAPRGGARQAAVPAGQALVQNHKRDAISNSKSVQDPAVAGTSRRAAVSALNTASSAATSGPATTAVAASTGSATATGALAGAAVAASAATSARLGGSARGATAGVGAVAGGDAAVAAPPLGAARAGGAEGVLVPGRRNPPAKYLTLSEAASELPPAAAAARELLLRLVDYLPSNREDGPALLAPYMPYQYGPYQEAAVVAAAHPDLVLRPLGLQQLSYISAAYAAAGHRHEPFLRELASVAAEKMVTPRRTRGAAAAAVAGQGPPSPATPSPAAPLTFRTVCVMLTAMARLRYRHADLTAALGRWLAAALRSGTVVPRAKWKGTWLAAALWAYGNLEQLAARDEVAAATGDNGTGIAGNGGKGPETTVAGVLLFSEAAEAIRVDPAWIHLMDCREALWALWAFKVAAVMYGQQPENAAAAVTASAGPRATVATVGGMSYTPQPLVELQLLERAASQLDQLDPGHLAEAYAVAAEAGFGADRDMLAALRRCTLARVAAVRPQPLAVMVASLAVMRVQDVVWLTALAAACRNKMINMKPEQIVVVLHSLSVALRFYYMPLFEAAAVMCTLPGFARLDGMPAGDVVRLAVSYAAVGHYEAILMRRMAEHMLTLGSAATVWQRASVLVSCARLAYRSNKLLRAVATEAFALAAPGAVAASAAPPPSPPSALPWGSLPAAQLVAVAAACGQLQFRPPWLLRALYAAKAAEWPRLALGQRASLCWSLLVLTGCLADPTAPTSTAAGTCVPGASPGSVEDGGGGAAALAAAGHSSGSLDTNGVAAVTAAVQRRRQRGRSDDAAAQPKAEQQHQQSRTLAAERWRQRQEEQQQLVEALCDYLRQLAFTDPRVWPNSDHHTQLLAACCVLALQQPQEQHLGQQGGYKKQKKEKLESERAAHGIGQAATGTAAPPTEVLPALPATAVVRGASEEASTASSTPTGGAAWAALSASLRGAVERLPTAATRKTLAAQHRQRQAALGPWATQVADVVRQVVDAAVVTDAAEPGPGATALRRLVRGGTVTQWALLSGGALGVDVAVELELESVAHDGGGPAQADTVGAAGADVAAGIVGGSAGGAPVSTAAVPVGKPAAGQRLRIAFELCALQPPGAGMGSSGAGGPGSGVVRNSRWLLSGPAALRRRLLTRLGWMVVPVRERTWQGLRSPEQRRRAVEALLGRAVARVSQVKGPAAAGAITDRGEAMAVAPRAGVPDRRPLVML